MKKDSKKDEKKENPPARENRPRERTPLEVELSELQALFSKTTNLPEPQPSTDKERRAAADRWYQPLRRIQRTCNGRSADCIRAAIKRMRKDGLTISSISSIEQTAIALYGELNTAAASKYTDV